MLGNLTKNSWFVLHFLVIVILYIVISYLILTMSSFWLVSLHMSCKGKKKKVITTKVIKYTIFVSFVSLLKNAIL